MKVSWGYDSQYMESHKTHVPNHQPAIVLTIIILTKNYITIIVPVDDLHGIYMVFTWYLHGIYMVFTWYLPGIYLCKLFEYHKLQTSEEDPKSPSPASEMSP